MKKFILGTLFGAFLISATAYADEVKLMIGKTVDGTFPVKVNGKALSVEAIVIEGTSYAPVRAIGEAVGLKVEFDSKVGITLNNLIATNEYPKLEGDARLRQIDEQIIEIQTENVGLRIAIARYTDNNQMEFWKQRLAENEAKIEQLQKEKEELEKQR